MVNTRGKRKEMEPVDEVMGQVKEEVVKKTKRTVKKDVSELKVPQIRKGIVICSNLNVRKEPTTGATILQIITKDTEVKILDDVNETWYKVRVSEIVTGFCMKEFIKVIN